MSKSQSELQEKLFALHELTVNDGAVVELNGAGFDAEQYSRFKYGDADASDMYAARIADGLLREKDIDMSRTYVASSAYKNVPTAAYHITAKLLCSMALNGKVPRGFFRIDRGVVYDQDYAALTEQERHAAMENNRLEINPGMARELAGQDVLILDDIKITGQHEAALKRQLSSIGIGRLILCYVAILDPVAARLNPAVEHQINSTKVKTLDDIAEIINSGRFYLNARTCKFLLKQSPDALAKFISQIPTAASQAIVSSIISDGYHQMSAFNEQFSSLNQALKVRLEEDRRVMSGSLAMENELTVINSFNPS